MSRWKAAGIHLCISLLVTLVLGMLLLGVWYPPPYFRAAGADELMLLLVGIDLVVGPLLTLIIFRAGKPGLRFDLSFIAVVQAAMFSYGMTIVLESRPVFLVGEIDRFVLVSANEIDLANMQKARNPAFRTLSWTGPQLVGAKPPTDSQEKNDVLFSAAFAHRDIDQLPSYYTTYDEQASVIIAHGRSIDELRKRHPEGNVFLDAFIHTQADPADLAWMPLAARRHDLVMIISRRTGTPLRALEIDPW